MATKRSMIDTLYKEVHQTKQLIEANRVSMAQILSALFGVDEDKTIVEVIAEITKLKYQQTDRSERIDEKHEILKSENQFLRATLLAVVQGNQELSKFRDHIQLVSDRSRGVDYNDMSVYPGSKGF